MTYQRFEDLPVWNYAIALAEGCEDFIISARDCITWSKRDQLDRASLSVSNNIAEGFERGTTNELLNFLYIARGSAGEVRSMLCYFERRPALKDLKSQISNPKPRAARANSAPGRTPSKTPPSKANATSTTPNAPARSSAKRRIHSSKKSMPHYPTATLQRKI